MKSHLKKYKLGETGFWPAWLSKLLFTLISVKVWGLIAATSISTWLLILNYRNSPLLLNDRVIEYGINGAQWVTFNTTIWALIYGMKEIFKIAEHRNMLYLNFEESEEKESTPEQNPGSKHQKTDEKDPEFEEVGPEPDITQNS